MELKRCFDCKFWAAVAHGWSNFTVCETSIHCLKKHFEPTEDSILRRKGSENPNDDDEFYKQAQSCADFKKGIGIILDIDEDLHIEDHKADEELYQSALDYGLKRGERYNH
jgi:hypothetical protein